MQEKAKIKIQDLIRRYEAVRDSDKIGRYTEEETKKDFIIPLFEALGWDVYDSKEVTAEEQISGNRVDYGFYLSGQPKFYLEAKNYPLICIAKNLPNKPFVILGTKALLGLY